MITQTLLYETLTTLLENIPYDLLKVYKTAKKYDSQRHPDTYHTEFGRDPLDPRTRRSKTYDYGNASYNVITAEDAINLVRQNKANVSNLRIIFDGKLVEYELRDNGNIYAIYGDVDDRVTINDKPYRNIRYAPWRAVLQNADKIYVTDEYDKLLPPRSTDINQVDAIGSVNTKLDGYQPHFPADNFKQNLQFVQSNPDTGRHINTSENEYPDTPSARFIDSGILHQSPSDVLQNLLDKSVRNASLTTLIRNYFDTYNKLKYDKKVAYIEYNAARKAYKKLIRDKDDYTEREYEAAEAKLKAKKDAYLARYNKIAKDFANVRTKVIANIGKEGLKANNRISDYVADIQQLSGKIHALKVELANYVNRNASTNTSDLDSTAAMYRKQLVTYATEISKLEAELSAQKTNLEAAGKALEHADIETLEGRIAEYLNEIANVQELLETHQKANIEFWNSSIAKLEAELKTATDKMDQLQPRSAERRRQNAERNQGKLDPRLVDLIDFVDYE